jgi:hypothetical protein
VDDDMLRRIMNNSRLSERNHVATWLMILSRKAARDEEDVLSEMYQGLAERISLGEHQVDSSPVPGTDPADSETY